MAGVSRFFERRATLVVVGGIIGGLLGDVVALIVSTPAAVFLAPIHLLLRPILAGMFTGWFAYRVGEQVVQEGSRGRLGLIAGLTTLAALTYHLALYAAGPAFAATYVRWPTGQVLYGLVAGVAALKFRSLSSGPAIGRHDRGIEGGAWVPRRKVLLATGLLGSLALLFLGAFVVPAALACSAEERAVFEEFDQYVGYVEPEGNPEGSTCAAYYEVPDSQSEVFSYFEDRLAENGWQQRPEEAGQVQGEGGELVPTGLVAYRDGYRYEVLTEGRDAPGSEAGPTHVAVHVRSES